MAQFDVFENPNVAQREGFPYLVVLQSAQLDHLSTRFVMPLARLAERPANAPRRLAQTIAIEGEAVQLAAHLCAALPACCESRWRRCRTRPRSSSTRSMP